MVKLHVKKGEESLFLYETTCDVPLDQLISTLVKLQNGRLKVDRLCQEIELLVGHGCMLPPNMQGLTEEQLAELKLVDEWAERCVPSGGYVTHKDVMGRRNGRAPNDKMKEVLRKTISEARAAVSKKQAQEGVCMTEDIIREAMMKLQGAVTIVYPMNLPPHDPIRLEFEGTEDLSGTQASLEVMDEKTAQLWWAGKELVRGKKLLDYIGKNEKTKIVAKLQKKGQGAPSREPVFSEEEKKQMMLHAYRRQEDLKKLEAADDDSYLNAEWADPSSLKQAFHGVKNISWRPR